MYGAFGDQMRLAIMEFLKSNNLSLGDFGWKR